MMTRLLAIAFVWWATGILTVIGAQDIYAHIRPQPRLIGTTTIIPCDRSQVRI